jgi:hypothetical protein
MSITFGRISYIRDHVKQEDPAEVRCVVGPHLGRVSNVPNEEGVVGVHHRNAVAGTVKRHRLHIREGAGTAGSERCADALPVIREAVIPIGCWTWKGRLHQCTALR